MNGWFNTTVFTARRLGGLRSNNTCNLFGWGGQHSNPPNEAIRVYESSFCDSKFPQIFCSVFDSSFVRSCSSNAASPLMCNAGGSLQSISGLVVATNNSCLESNDRTELNFIAIEPFIDWIEEVSAGRKLTTMTSLFLLSVVWSFVAF
jgi:hypothetical protein